MPVGRRLPMEFDLPGPSIARADSRGRREGEASVRLGGQAGLDYTLVDMCSELLTRTRSAMTGRGESHFQEFMQLPFGVINCS
jgi:hypothetical protein